MDLLDPCARLGSHHPPELAFPRGFSKSFLVGKPNGYFPAAFDVIKESLLQRFTILASRILTPAPFSAPMMLPAPSVGDTSSFPFT